MSKISIASVEPPLDTPELAVRAARVLIRAESIGLFQPEEHVTQLGQELLQKVLKAVASAGIARDPIAELVAGRGIDDPARSRQLLDEVYRDMETCPTPDAEWKRLLQTFTPEQLAPLVGISEPSVRRYSASRGSAMARVTPDKVADRLHLLALVVDGLAGSYNDYGIRRWFDRPRAQLDGRAPRDVLRGSWSSDDPGPRRVRELADRLAGGMLAA